MTPRRHSAASRRSPTPAQSDFESESANLMNAACKPIASAPRKLQESLCVQGSGTLKSEGAVSFAKRECACATGCPRKAVTPLVRWPSDLSPLGNPLHWSTTAARGLSGTATRDGCFIAEDHGLAVKGGTSTSSPAAEKSCVDRLVVLSRNAREMQSAAWHSRRSVPITKVTSPSAVGPLQLMASGRSIA